MIDEYFQENKNKYKHNTPVLKESFYYREFLRNIMEDLIMLFHIWMPKWCGDMTDSKCEGNRIIAITSYRLIFLYYISNKSNYKI